MIVVSDAPSSKPSPLLHFTLDPLRHKLDARTRANKSRALTNAHVSEYDLFHLAAMLVATCFKSLSCHDILHYVVEREMPRGLLFISGFVVHFWVCCHFYSFLFTLHSSSEH